MRAAAALLALLLAGCGGGSGPLELVSADPPEGATAAGKRAERQGSNDPDAGEPIYRLEPAEGDELAYTVSVRNTGDEPVSVTGVVADAERDGPFVPEGVEGAPVEVAPGATEDVVVTGRVSGCRFGGQRVPLAGPELKLRRGGEESTQSFDLGLQVELVTSRDGCDG